MPVGGFGVTEKKALSAEAKLDEEPAKLDEEQATKVGEEPANDGEEQELAGLTGVGTWESPPGMGRRPLGSDSDGPANTAKLASPKATAKAAAKDRLCVARTKAKAKVQAAKETKANRGKYNGMSSEEARYALFGEACLVLSEGDRQRNEANRCSEFQSHIIRYPGSDIP